MPCPTFPAIEPDASNTIMASSLHGEGCGSSARTASTSHAAVTASEIAARQTEKSLSMLCAPWGCPADAQSTLALYRSGAWETIGQSRVFSSASTSSSSLLALTEAAILFGHAHEVHDAAPTCPGVALVSKGNDVDGKLVASGMELLAELTRRPSASLFTVGDHDDDARLVAEVECLGRLLDALCQRRFSGRNDRIHGVHDGKSGICRRLELEFVVALVVRSRTVGHEADATKFGGVRQYSGKSR